MKRSLLGVLLLSIGCAKNTPTETGVAAVTPPTSGMETSAYVDESNPDSGGATEPPCTSSGFMTYVASTDAYEDRVGLHATHFSELRTSQASPFEECGLDAVLERLVTLQCDDGSNPFQGSRQAAHMSRAGSTGAGGRCGAIIDVYEVPCPEGTYSVFNDLYFCPAGRSPR